MKYLVGLFLTFCDIIFQQTFITNNLYLLIIFLIILSSEDKKSIVFLFVAGIIIDLTGGTPMGKNSLGLLIGWGLIYSYRRRFSFNNAIVSIVFFSLFYFCSLTIGGRLWYGSELAIYGLFILSLTLVTPWIANTRGGRLQL